MNKFTGLKSPRMFFNYDPTNVPERNVELFRSSLNNSFPDHQLQVNFVNKLYQCLLGRGLPLKLKKLIACGAQDSGKTSWMYILKGKVNKSYIALHKCPKYFLTLSVLARLFPHFRLVIFNYRNDAEGFHGNDLKRESVLVQSNQRGHIIGVHRRMVHQLPG